jgi:hypothetical protein
MDLVLTQFLVLKELAEFFGVLFLNPLDKTALVNMFD